MINRSDNCYVQQMMPPTPENPNNWWSNTTVRPPPPESSNYLLTPYSNSSSLHLPPESSISSWTQLLMSGVVYEEDKDYDIVDHVKQETSVNNYVYGNQEFQGTTNSNTWSQIVSVPTSNSSSSSSSKSSCVTNFTTNMLDFSNNKTDDTTPSDPYSHQCNNGGGGGALKKARVQPSTTFKVRKEKLGDRITALHQLVSPFGKTDTASVLLESIGYIRFLHSQIEALSIPYLGNGAGNMQNQQQQHSVHGEKNCLFPDDPGQLLNENCLKKKAASIEQDCEEEENKDLRSRGLCLVPISCTQQVGSDNGADYWAPAFGAGFR